MRSRVLILLCALLLVCVAGLGALPAAGQPQADGTHLEAQLQDDGDAEWTVSVHVPVEDDRDRAEFESFADQFEAGAVDIDLGSEAFERAAAEASAATDREMEITSIERESELRNETTDGETFDEYGVLRVSFTWESFARETENNTLYVDDAFNTTDGTWLPGLGADQSLTIKAPPGYSAPTTSPIGADEGDLHWTGPETFEPGYFRIVYHPGTTTPPVEGGTSDTLVIGALALSGAALLVGVYLLIGRRTEDDADAGRATGPGSGGYAETAVESEAESSDATGPVPTGSNSLEEQDGRDLELLSDEERVEYLLEKNGGRMKQANIVKETGWSNAKVSQLLSAMNEADRIDKLRIGRENLISLPGEGVGELKSEADDER